MIVRCTGSSDVAAGFSASYTDCVMAVWTGVRRRGQTKVEAQYLLLRGRTIRLGDQIECLDVDRMKMSEGKVNDWLRKCSCGVPLIAVALTPM
jgi:molybdopterin-biosynthesis enzyme MoeA-like protein